MFQRKLIAVLSVVALLAVTAGTGHASLSRVEGMGSAARRSASSPKTT